MEEWEREVELTTARQTNTRLRPAVRDLWSSLLAGRVVVMIGTGAESNRARVSEGPPSGARVERRGVEQGGKASELLRAPSWHLRTAHRAALAPAVPMG